MTLTKQQGVKADSLPTLRFEIGEAARILRISRASLYNRIHEGALRLQKDGSRTFITWTELERYVASCSRPVGRATARSSHR